MGKIAALTYIYIYIYIYITAFFIISKESIAIRFVRQRSVFQIGEKPVSHNNWPFSQVSPIIKTNFDTWWCMLYHFLKNKVGHRKCIYNQWQKYLPKGQKFKYCLSSLSPAVNVEDILSQIVCKHWKNDIVLTNFSSKI